MRSTQALSAPPAEKAAYAPAHSLVIHITQGLRELMNTVVKLQLFYRLEENMCDVSSVDKISDC